MAVTAPGPGRPARPSGTGRTAGWPVSAGRRLLAALDALPVAALAMIKGAGSFTRIRDTAAQHGQAGPMSWAVAVCIDLTCVMAARERQRDKQLGNPTWRLSWPHRRPRRRCWPQPGRQPRPGPADRLRRGRGSRPAWRVPGRGLHDRAPRRPTPAGRRRCPRTGRQCQRPARGGTAVPGPRSRVTPCAGAAGRRRAPGPRAADRPRRAARRLGVSNRAASDLLRQIRAGQGADQ
jgi:hypothetical protein